MKQLIEDTKQLIASVKERQQDILYANNPMVQMMLKEKRLSNETMLERLTSIYDRQQRVIGTVLADLSELYVDINRCQTKNKSNKDDVLIAKVRCNNILDKLEEEYSSGDTSEQPE